MKEDRKFYKQLRAAGVPFVDSHLIAKKVAKGDSFKAFQFACEKDWSKKGPSDYKWNEFYEELYSYSSLVLPEGEYLIYYSHSGLYIDIHLPALF